MDNYFEVSLESQSSYKSAYDWYRDKNERPYFNFKRIQIN